MSEKYKEPLAMFETKKEPRKSFQTFLRNQVKIQLNSLNMIDRKAAIMIRINSTIISAIVIFSNKIQSLPNGHYIGIILIVSCFLSLLLALNASRPNTFKIFFEAGKTIKKRRISNEERVFVPGAAADMSIEDYEKTFDKIVNNQKLQVGNQVRGLHFMEKQIRNAFMHIELSYLIFMIGFFAVVTLFIHGNCNI